MYCSATAVSCKEGDEGSCSHHHIPAVAWCGEWREGLVSLPPSLRFVQAIRVAWGWFTLVTLCSISCCWVVQLPYPFKGVCLGVSCFKLYGFISLPCLVTMYCWSRSVGCLISDRGSCLQVFQYHPDIKGQTFCFCWTLKKKYCLYWERLCCILRTDKRLGEMTWQLERGRRRVCWQPLAPTESALRQDKAASDAKWAEYWVAQLALLTVLGNLRSQMSRGRPSGQGLSLFWFWFTLLGACVNRRLKDLCWCKGL